MQFVDLKNIFKTGIWKNYKNKKKTKNVRTAWKKSNSTAMPNQKKKKTQ